MRLTIRTNSAGTTGLALGPKGCFAFRQIQQIAVPVALAEKAEWNLSTAAERAYGDDLTV